MSIAPLSRVMAADTGTDSTKSTSTARGTAKDPATTTKTKDNTELGREAFLQLLVAQLKYQDPSKPMDASEMIAQSAQLSMVDKLAEMSTTLAAQAVTQRLTLAGSVVGKEITFTSTDGNKITATVNSVKFVNGDLVLSTPDWDVPMNSVESIGTAPAAPAAAPATPAASTPAASTPAASTPAAATAAATAADPPAADPPAATPVATSETPDVPGP